jgi:membrane protein DedA with SNARE-associated domain
MKKGFWTGLLSFVIAKVVHLLITGLIGFTIGLAYAQTPDDMPWGFIRVIDSPIIGIIFLIFTSIYIYGKLTKNKKQLKNN